MVTSFDEYCMRRAIFLAETARAEGEIPIGAVLTLNGEIVAEAYNQSIASHDPTAHAEIIVMRLAAAKLKNYRLVNTTLYSTLEPCCMCAGAMIHARITRLVFAAADPRAGAVGSIFQLLNHVALNHRVNVECGLLAQESSGLLQRFFQERRKKEKIS